MKRNLAFVTLGLIHSMAAEACLWDDDTLAAEKARFPGAEEIIFGNFPRHSKEFYEWRKARSEKLIAADRTQSAFYDDLAVAQHKLGDHRGAIDTMMRKEGVDPGKYETYSNLGTFYIYTGDLKVALRWIDKALAINPDAHFGRERYQKWLVEWILAGKPDGEIRRTDHLDFAAFGFADFVLRKQPILARSTMTEALRRHAIRGVSGMMRFADFDNPLLQEALGDLLITGKSEVNATHHASLAYLHAAKHASGKPDQERILAKFDRSKKTIMEGMKPSGLADELAAGVANGRKLAEQVRQDEIAWIAAGKDASAEFQRKYLKP